MKKRLLSLLLAFAMVVTMIPMGTFKVSAAEIPDGAPFTALTTDAGDALGYEDMGTVDYTGYSTYDDVPYYHVTIPAAATKVYVTHPSSENPFADASNGSAYGYYAETSGWTGSGMSYAFEAAEDGYTITLPLSKGDKSFVADEDGYVAYALAVERNTYDPIAFFSFEYGEAEAPECEEHSYENGICSVCGAYLIGDVNGDSNITMMDYIKLNKLLLNDEDLTDYQKIVADVNADQKVDEEDVFILKAFSLVEHIDELPYTGEITVVSETAPTCTESGQIVYAFEGITGPMTETVPATGHTEVDDAAVDPTCTETGLTAGKHCSVCNTVTVEQTTVDATGHSFTDGTCSVCGEAEAPECEEHSYENGICSVCGAYLIGDVNADNEINTRDQIFLMQLLTGKKEINDYHRIAADVNADGEINNSDLAVMKLCSVSDSFSDVTFPYKGEYTLETTAPTCTENGKEVYVFNDYPNVPITIDIAATGHTEVDDAAVEPTCTETGLTAGKHCSVCNTVTVEQTAVDAKGHSFEEGSCTVCGEEDPDYVAPDAGAEIPDGAPFTALTTDAGDALGYEDMGTVSYDNGWGGTYDNVPYYHVTIPAGATKAYVTHPASEDPFADTSYGSAYGYYASTEEWTGGAMTYDFEEAEDGYTITLPLSKGDKSFVADEDGYVAYALAVERNTYDPIAFFSFEYGEAAEQECDHNYADGVCTKCGEADPDYVAPEIPDDTAPENAPFTAITTNDGTVIASEKITFVKNVNYNTFGVKFPYYHVKVPAGTEKVTVSYPDGSNAAASAWYADTTNWEGDYFAVNSIGELPLTKDELSFVGENGTAPYAVATETDANSGYKPIAFFTFEYEAKEPDPEPERKFTQITAGETVIDESKIEYKGIFSLGDNPEGDDDGYPYIHEVPYYIVTVPTGTETVDITYTADADIMNSGTNAYGYKTYFSADDADLTASATVRSATFSNAYTKNSDGTQTVTTSVKDNTVNGDTRYATTLEGNDTPFAALTLFSFNYEAHEHNYEAKVTNPSCDKAGYTTHTCTLCFDSYKDSETEAKGHNYTPVVTEPTCTATGYTTYTCSNCGDDYISDYTDAIGHTAKDEGVVTEPTCTDKGYTTYICGTCGETFKANEVAATGHNYEAVVTAPTCTTKGYTTHTCSVCGNNYKDSETELAEHSYGENGCTVCGAPVEVDGVYQIGSEAALKWFETFVEAGNTTVKAKLTADITVTDWNGIGTSSKKFAGEFDGDGHTVTISNGTNGLFAYAKSETGSKIKIKNVTVDGKINGSANVAGIAGTAQLVEFTNCINNADIIGGNNTGGIVGNGFPSVSTNADLTFKNCTNNGDIEGSSKIGGIIGYANGKTIIENSCNTGNVKGSGDVGGLVGWIKGYPSNGSVTNCYNTGKVDGSSNVGGLIGYMYNGVTMTNCYNAGECTNAIVGRRYNKVAQVINVYYLATASANAVGVYELHGTENFSATPKAAVEMSSAEFAALLGEAFKQSCPSPVLIAQTSADHAGMEDGICDKCNFGSTEKAEFTVTLPTDERIIVTGETNVTEGESYTFAIDFAKGYMAGNDFAVTATNYDVVDNGDGTYTVENVISDFAISVSGIVEAKFTVTLPGLGNGYAVVDNSSTTVNKGDNFTFKVEIKENFKAGDNFAVKANGITLTAVDGVYTIADVKANQTITIEDVEIVPYPDTVNVNFTVTQGTDEYYYADASDTTVVFKDMDIPYFDLELYDLEKYYFNPDCYEIKQDNEGNEIRVQTPGTRETAYGTVTAMHAFIYATEVYYLGYDEGDAGTGLSDINDSDNDGKSDFDEAISWTQDAGSSFMNLWGFGENLNYYVNYTYPLGLPAWGSTSDQIKLKDGDIFTAHMIVSDKGSASGSNFPFFVVNDENGMFDVSDTEEALGETVVISDQVDTATVKQGDKVELTLYLANPGEGYTTAYTKQPDKQLYMAKEAVVPQLWVEDEGEVLAEVWTETEYVTDENGKVEIDTTNLEPDTYYFVAEGGMTAGGVDLGDGFISKGGETGLATFKLVVEEGETPPTPESFEVKVPVDDGYTVTGGTSVDYGATYVFTVAINDGYEMSDDFAVKVNGVTVMPDENGVYKVIDVTTALEITVEGVVEKAETPTPETVYGDIDGNGELTYKEALTVLAAFRGKTEMTAEQLSAADIDGNGELEYKEALTILKNFRAGEQGE